jgi:hypothetical protein
MTHVIRGSPPLHERQEASAPRSLRSPHEAVRCASCSPSSEWVAGRSPSQDLELLAAATLAQGRPHSSHAGLEAVIYI